MRAVDENTGPNQPVGSPVAALDDDGDAMTYALSGGDAAAFDIDAGSGQIRTKAALDHETKSSYRLTVTATDRFESGSVSVTVTVNEVNEKPSLSGPYRVPDYPENSSFVVAEYTATDPEGDTIELLLEMPGIARDFESFTLDSGRLKFVMPPDYESPTDSAVGGHNTYILEVSARDNRDANGDADSAVDDFVSVFVVVTDVNEPPTLTSSDAVDKYRENSTDAVAEYTATDPEGSTVGWTLTGPDRARFDLVGNRPGERSLQFRSPPDYESPADTSRGGRNTYYVTVVADDGTRNDSQDVVVTVTNAEEPGTVTLSSQQPQAGTPLTASLSDPDGRVSRISWSWERLAERHQQLDDDRRRAHCELHAPAARCGHVPARHGVLYRRQRHRRGYGGAG